MARGESPKHLSLNEDFRVYNAQGPVQGTYTVDTSLNGSIRGQINIPSFTFPSYPSSPTSPALQFVFVLAADGKSGNIEERDAGLSVISGKFINRIERVFARQLRRKFRLRLATAFNGNVASNNNWQGMVGRLLSRLPERSNSKCAGGFLHRADRPGTVRCRTRR